MTHSWTTLWDSPINEISNNTKTNQILQKEGEDTWMDKITSITQKKRAKQYTVGTESIQTPLNFSLFVILQPFAKII